MFCLWQKTGVYTLTTQWKFLLPNPTQWQFLLYNPTRWYVLSVTENRCVYTDYTMKVLTTQSYTMRVLLFVTENRCVYTDYTIPVPTQWEFFCLWQKTGVCPLITQSQFLHSESSSVCDAVYTNLCNGSSVWLADMWDCASSGWWVLVWLLDVTGWRVIFQFPSSESILVHTQQCLSCLCINLQSAPGPVCIKDPMSTCE